MDEGQKKTVMIGVIVACLVLAGILVFARRGGGGGGVGDIPSDSMVWVKCASCGAAYEMGEREFYEESQKRMVPGAMTPTPLTCKECGKDAIRLAVKCQNPDCGNIFFEGAVPGDFPDRCPKCKQSATEESRKRRKAEAGSGQ
jgi:hypothetical protein